MTTIARGLYEIADHEWHGAMHQEVLPQCRWFMRDGKTYFVFHPDAVVEWKNWSFTYEEISNVESRKENHEEEGTGSYGVEDFIVPAPVDPETGLPEGVTRDADGRLWVEQWCYPREGRRHAVFYGYD